MKKYIYELMADDGYGNTETKIKLKANNESEALDIAKSLIKKMNYFILNIEEIDNEKK